MPTITLPDGSTRDYEDAVTALQIANDISPSLAKAAVAAKVDGHLYDLNREIETDVPVAIVTRDSDDGLEVLRHDAAHVLAEAVKELYPETQVTIGPAIDNGFYYDFAREIPFSEDDLEVIEARMREIVERDETITR
ncbi:MAG: TGS domain-containing protein, partial [Pseudomonadota bacterium]